MKAKTIIMATLAISTIFLLASCGTTAETNSHSMDDGSNMAGKTHEEAVKNGEASGSVNSTDTQSGGTDEETTGSHAMEDKTTMSGSKEDMHPMDDGSKMEGKTHEEAVKKGIATSDKKTEKKVEVKKEPAPAVDEESIVGDGKSETMHAMDDGSTMSGTEESMSGASK